MTKVSCISMQSNSVKKRDLLVQGCNVTLQFAPGNPPRAGIEQEQMEMAEKSTRQLHSYVSSMIAVSCPLALGQCSEQDRGHRELQQQRRAAACPLQGECLWVVGWHLSMLPQAHLTGIERLGSS